MLVLPSVAKARGTPCIPGQDEGDCYAILCIYGHQDSLIKAGRLHSGHPELLLSVKCDIDAVWGPWSIQKHSQEQCLLCICLRDVVNCAWHNANQHWVSIRGQGRSHIQQTDVGQDRQLQATTQL